jgi:hypothetical protein
LMQQMQECGHPPKVSDYESFGWFSFNEKS